MSILNTNIKNDYLKSSTKNNLIPFPELETQEAGEKLSFSNQLDNAKTDLLKKSLEIEEKKLTENVISEFNDNINIFNDNNISNETIKIKQKIFIVSGLLFGDEGKGTTVEYLASKFKAKLVVRFSGGPQAAHHVVLENKLWHCFSQLGCGMFEPECETLLSSYMVINPITLLREVEVICKKGISEAEVLKKLFIDKNCFIVTPYHKLLNISKEILRKGKNHGSTGLGVGVALDEAMYSDLDNFPKAKTCYEKEKEIAALEKQAQLFSEEQEAQELKRTTLQVKDFYDRNIFFKKLKSLIEEKLSQINKIIKQYNEINEIDPNFVSQDKYIKEVTETVAKFKAEFSLVKLLKIYIDWFDYYKKYGIFIDDSATFISKYIIEKKANVIFEGSQGSLLDRIYGFYPHITKSLCSYDNAEKILSKMDCKQFYDLIKIGVLRIYSSRHGKGPFITENEHWNKLIKEDHNEFGRFQGVFKIGPFDSLAAKYGLQILNPDIISLTCVDKLSEKLNPLLINTASSVNSNTTNSSNDVNKTQRLIYLNKIENVDYYVCEYYFIDYLPSEIANNSQKNKIITNELIEHRQHLINELRKRNILEIVEFTTRNALESYFIDEIKTKQRNFFMFEFSSLIIDKYVSLGQKILLIKKINLGDDFYNFKNDSLCSIISLCKGIYYKNDNNPENNRNNMLNQAIPIHENFTLQNSTDGSYKLSKNVEYDCLLNHIQDLQENLAKPIKIISFGPTKNDKILIDNL